MMSQAEYLRIKQQLTTQAYIDWPAGEVKDGQQLAPHGADLIAAIDRLVNKCLREGERIGIKETSDSARAQLRDMVPHV